MITSLGTVTVYSNFFYKIVPHLVVNITPIYTSSVYMYSVYIDVYIRIHRCIYIYRWIYYIYIYNFTNDWYDSLSVNASCVSVLAKYYLPMPTIEYFVQQIVSKKH